MKLGRGFFRLWLVVSALWIGLVLWNSDLACGVKTALEVRALWCQFELVDPAHYYTALAFRSLAVPVIAAIAMYLVLWILVGFRTRRSK